MSKYKLLTDRGKAGYELENTYNTLDEAQKAYENTTHPALIRT